MMGKSLFSNNHSLLANDMNHDTTPTVKDVDKLSVKHAEPGTSSQFKEFIKSVISFSGDLSSLTCPAFFLNGLSLLEYGTYWGDHPSSFKAVAEATDPQDRMLVVTRWFISTLWGSYASRCSNGLTEKKPYNPILGEQFFCTLDDVICICEQVCHHPPISAFYLENEKAGVSLNGHCGQKSRFKGTSIKVEQVGRATLYIKPFDEQYVIDFPDLIIRGFLTGAAYLELSGTCTLTSTSGASASIAFIPKPWFGGEHNCIKGVVTYQGKEYFTLSGRWSHQSFYSKSGSTEKELLFDAEAEPMAKRVTRPLEEQSEIESHRLWGPVTAALQQKNYHVANAEKSRIEDWQRGLRRERAERNEEWKPALFLFLPDDEERDTYVRRSNQLVQQYKRRAFLDHGAWTYHQSLHMRS